LVRLPASGVGSPESTSERMKSNIRQEVASFDYSQANVGFEAGTDLNLEIVYEKRIFLERIEVKL